MKSIGFLIWTPALPTLPAPPVTPAGGSGCGFTRIVGSGVGGTLYIGVTNDLVRRVYEHRTNAVPGFTRKYGVHRLVYYEQFGDIELAIQREKRLKKWNRGWKIELIEKTNPNWIDLFPGIASP